MLYVDHQSAPLGRMTMSHLMADTQKELLQAADALGLRHSWLQNKDQPSEHFDVSESKRKLAIDRLGAVPVTSRKLVEVVRRKRTDLEKMPQEKDATHKSQETTSETDKSGQTQK